MNLTIPDRGQGLRHDAADDPGPEGISTTSKEEQHMIKPKPIILALSGAGLGLSALVAVNVQSA
jgi:hypothetical protein